jgi:hypothetical protein
MCLSISRRTNVNSDAVAEWRAARIARLCDVERQPLGMASIDNTRLDCDSGSRLEAGPLESREKGE